MVFPYNFIAGREIYRGMIHSVKGVNISPYYSSEDKMTLHFKPAVDFTCVSALVKAVREGTLLDNRAENLDHAFWLGGSVNAYFAEHKEPQVFGTISVPNELEGEDNLLIRLKAEIPAAFEDKPAMGATAHGEHKKVEMNPVVAAMLKKLIQLALEQLLK